MHMLQVPVQAYSPHQLPLRDMDDTTFSQETASAASASKALQKPRKMRASCDACSRAKVKCDKVRPTCQRCGTINICCNYSPSMRLGKPRKNRNLDGTIKREVSPTGSYRPTGAQFDLIPRTASHTSESSPEPIDPFYFGPSTPEFHYQDAFVANNFGDNLSPACSEGGAMSFVSAWANDDHMMFGSQTDMFIPMPQYLPQQHTPAHGHVRSISTHSQPDLFASLESQQPSPHTSHQLLSAQPNMFTSQETVIDSPSPTLSAALSTPPAWGNFATHDCTLSAFRTLNNLYVPLESQTSTSDFASAMSGSPKLESILATNRAAVDSLYTLLECDCTSNPHFASTINLATMKILSWFQAIARAHDHQRGLPYISLETQLELCTQPHTSDSEAECAQRTSLVLAELCRIEKLIDKFAERYCRRTGTPSDLAEPDINSGVYLSMEASLRTRVRDTFRITMAVAPDSVKRRMASSRTTQNRMRVNTM